MSLQQEITKLLSFSANYSYPMTAGEILQGLQTKSSLTEVDQCLQKMNLASADGLITLPTHSDLLDIRKQKEIATREHWNYIELILPVLQKVPFVLCIGVTGSLAYGNSQRNDDIDFIVITEESKVWIVRLILYFIEKYYAINHPKPYHLCFNFIVSNKELEFRPSFLVARELVQMVPIVNYNKTYQKTLQTNKWVENYLPNVSFHSMIFEYEKSNRWVQAQRKRKFNSLILRGLNWLEMKRACSKIYRSYKLTNETQFSEEMYKGHFSSHHKRAERYYNAIEM